MEKSQFLLFLGLSLLQLVHSFGDSWSQLQPSLGA